MIPMWVADTDFKTAPVFIVVFKERIDHGVFGTFDYILLVLFLIGVIPILIATGSKIQIIINIVILVICLFAALFRGEKAANSAEYQ